MLFVSPLDRIDSIHDHNSNPSKPVESMCAIGACFSPKKSIFVNAGQCCLIERAKCESDKI